MDKRPDMFEKLELSPADEKLVAHIRRARARRKLTSPITHRLAVEADIPAVMEIVKQARNALRRAKVDQWQGEYPTEDVFRGDIERGELYVLVYEDMIAGLFTLSSVPEPCYDLLTDGKWHFGEPYCVLHRNALRADFRGTGAADMLIQAVEEETRARGARAVRVDTHRKNKSMRALLERCGYRYAGNVLVHSEPGHDPRRQAFEKQLT